MRSDAITTWVKLVLPPVPAINGIQGPLVPTDVLAMVSVTSANREPVNVRVRQRKYVHRPRQATNGKVVTVPTDVTTVTATPVRREAALVQVTRSDNVWLTATATITPIPTVRTAVTAVTATVVCQGRRCVRTTRQPACVNPQAPATSGKT